MNLIFNVQKLVDPINETSINRSLVHKHSVLHIHKFSQRLVQVRLFYMFVSVGWWWHRLTVNTQTENVDAPSIHTRVVVYPVDAHCQIVLYKSVGVLLKGPLVGLSEFYADVSTMEQLNHLFFAFLPIFVHFQLLKLVKKAIVHKHPFAPTSMTFWTLWFLNQLNELYSLKIDLEIVFRIY